MAKVLSYYFYLLFVVFLIASCSQNPPQYPTTYTNDGFLDYSKKKAKEQKVKEELLIQDYLATQNVNFQKNKAGIYMHNPNTDSLNWVQKNDTISYVYSVKDLHHNELYSEQEIGKKTEVMNKARMIRGVEYALKEMSPNTQAVALIPSGLAYGNTGDGNKIYPNQPIIITLKLFNIKK